MSFKIYMSSLREVEACLQFIHKGLEISASTIAQPPEVAVFKPGGSRALAIFNTIQEAMTFAENLINNAGNQGQLPRKGER